jgi:hypothetical protein
MKKLLVFLAIGASCSIAATAQQLKESEVPSAAKSAFQKQYPNTTAKWEKEKGNYEVNFKKEGKSMSAVINEAGTITETETDIAVNALPQAVQSYLKTHYKGAKIKEAAKIEKANGEVNYEAEVNGKDVMFDSNGKFIEEAKD